MLVLTLTARAAPGKEPTLLGELETTAGRAFRAPGCYAAYALREQNGETFSLLSFWTNSEAAAKAFPTGIPDPPSSFVREPPEHRSYDGSIGVGRGIPLVTYVGIRVRDIDRSARFYTELLGMEPIDGVRVHPELNSKTMILRHPRTGAQIELNWYPSSGQFDVPFVTGEALDHIGVRVPDLPALIERARALGSEPADLRPFRDYPYHTEANGLRIAYLLDPDGNQVEVYEIPGLSVDAPYNGEY